MNTERMKKLESVSKHIVSEFIVSEIESKTDFGIITVTKIKISSDLSYLDIYVSSLKNSDKLTKALSKNGYNLQKKLNKTIQIRKLPKIRFRYDESGEIGQNIGLKIKSL